MNEDKDYTKIYGLSASIAVSLVSKAMFPNSEMANFASHEFKYGSKLCAAINKGIKPVDTVIEVLLEGQEARVVGKFEAGRNSFVQSLSLANTDQQRQYFIEEALENFDDAYNAMEYVPHLLNKKAQLAVYIGATHLSLGHYNNAKTWFLKAKEHYSDFCKVVIPNNYQDSVSVKHKGGSGTFHAKEMSLAIIALTLVNPALLPVVVGWAAVEFGSGFSYTETVDLNRDAILQLEKEQLSAKSALKELDEILLLF